MKIALTSIFVHDPLRAFKFYTEVLGFVEKLYLPEMNLAIVASRDETWRSPAALRARARELDRKMALGFSLESFVDSLVPRSSS